MRIIGHRSHLLVVLLALVVSAAALAPGAEADLRSGSHRGFLTASGALREPLPRLNRTIRVARAHNGTVKVVVHARYRTSNWRGAGRARRDRVLVFLTVGRRLLGNGPSRLGRVFERVQVDRRLRHRHANRRYVIRLNRQTSRFLVGRGAFSKRRQVRRRALRLITVRLEQDRDFKRVDGTYDWREGIAFSPLDRVSRPRRGGAKASGSDHPGGTLSVTNNTAAGVYCAAECPQWNQETSQAGTLQGTLNEPAYSRALAVTGASAVCVEQGVDGSNPEGFDNIGPEGRARPYAAGESLSDVAPGLGEVPATTGLTVTQPIVADDTLVRPSEEETEIAAAGSLEETNWGLFGIKTGASLAASSFGFAFSLPSPGSIVTGVLGIAALVLKGSCDETPNLLAVNAAEVGGASFSSEMLAEVENFGYYPSEAGMPASLQLNSSTASYQGEQLYLVPQVVRATGLADNVCDCGKYTGNNAIYIEWKNYEPCVQLFGDASDCSAAASPQTREVKVPGGIVACGPGNTACDFPAAAGLPTPATEPPASPPGEVTQCATNLRAGTTLSAGQAATSPNGEYTLAMLTNGTLAWFKGPANALWSSTEAQVAPAFNYGVTGIAPNSHATVQEDGNVVVYEPNGIASFATGTVGNPGDRLALQNDGNLVVYNAAGTPIWASDTFQGPACGE